MKASAIILTASAIFASFAPAATAVPLPAGLGSSTGSSSALQHPIPPTQLTAYDPLHGQHAFLVQLDKRPRSVADAELVAQINITRSKADARSSRFTLTRWLLYP